MAGIWLEGARILPKAGKLASPHLPYLSNFKFTLCFSETSEIKIIHSIESVLLM